MIQVTDKIWIGDSQDGEHAELASHGIGAILNVAHDLKGVRGWPDGVEYAQCGLVDGPGNTMAAYAAATLKLCALVLGGRKVLVHDHEAGSRSVAVIILACHAMHRRGWDYWLAMVRSKLGAPDFEPHEAHKRAFNRTNWRLVSAVLEG